MINGNIFIGFFILSVLISGCKKDESIDTSNTGNANQQNQLPPITTTGENTFGCKINGVVWLPDVPPGNIAISADYSNGQLFVTGSKFKYNSDFTSYTVFQSVGLKVFTGFSTSDTILLTWPHTWPSTSFDKAQGNFLDWVPGDCEYETDSLRQGYLKIIYLDSVNRIMSGVFEYDAWSSDCNSIIHVTEGRFDINY